MLMAIMNSFKTVVLLGLLTALLLFVGQLLGGTFGLIIGLVIAIAMNFGSYWFSDSIILKMYKAKPVSKKEAPDLYHMVEDVVARAKMPMPKVYIIPSSNPNAFATGRSPKHSAVAVTRGILDLLSKHELKGVIAHEISHIRNRDTLIATIAATIAGVISFIASMAQWAAIFGGFGNNDDDGGNIVQLLVLAILTPIIASLIQLAISRSREFMADESAAKILHDSHGLAGALRKLEQGSKMQPMQGGNTTTASLFIVNPFKAKGLVNLFSTHPTVEQRVNRLKNMRF